MLLNDSNKVDWPMLEDAKKETLFNKRRNKATEHYFTEKKS